MKAEGWYRDPYGLHEERWFSDGRATKLVRDGHVESSDPPPSGPPRSTELVRNEHLPSVSDGSDLRRADDAERGIDPRSSSDVAVDEMFWHPRI